MKQQLLHWIPRIICILAIPFLSLFALDSFTGDQSFFEKLGAFFIHLIPSYVMIILTFIAWKKELVGGLLLIVVSILAGIWLGNGNYNVNHSVIITMGIVLSLAGPFLAAGILFVVSDQFGKKVKAGKN